MEEGAGRRQDAFGLREIGLNLSTTQGDAQSMMYTQDSTVDTVMQPIGVATSRDDPASKIGKRLQKNTRKVTRYFPGKAPKWVKSNEDDDVKAFGASRRRRAAEPVVIKTGAAAAAAAAAEAPVQQPRRRQRAQAVVLKKAPAPAADAPPPPPVARPPPPPDSESDAEGDAQAAPVEAESADSAAARRARVRAKLKARQAAAAAAEAAPEPPPPPRDASPPRRAAAEPVPEAPVAAPAAASDGSSSDGSSSDDSDDSSDDDSADARPVFVPKALRGTILEREAAEEKERQREKAAEWRRKARADESRALVAEAVVRADAEAAMAKRGKSGEDSDDDAPDDADDLEDPLEFEAWRVRELARATRERDERRKAADDEAETLRRRALSPAARRAEDEKIGKGKKPEKAKWKFLQKYHHKGAFFMDDDTLAKAGEGDVRNRATDGAVLEDKFDRAALPKVMQVKDFGFQGRTKYTHLSDQDTTFVDRDNPMNGWLQRRHKADDPLRRGYDRRRGGTQDIDKAFERRRR